jgi:hypothetical protein
MVADFMDHRPSPEGAPASPLWLRPTAALGRTSCLIFLGSLNASLRISDKKLYVTFRHPSPADLSKSVVSYFRSGGFK